MSAKTGSAQSRYAGLLPIEPSEDFFRPIDLKPEDVPFANRTPSARKGPRARFLIAFCTGAATTLLWQSYGDVAREMLANSYPQVGWLAPQSALTEQDRRTPDVITPAAPAAEQLTSTDLDVVGQHVDESTTRMAADREPPIRSTDQMAPAQEPATRGTDQAAAPKATGVPLESRAGEASLPPTARLSKKPTEARLPQTLSERGKQLSSASRHDASCFTSASAVLRNHPGGWPSWTLRAPGHEGSICWYDAAHPRVSEHEPRVSDYRREMMRSEDPVGPADAELFAPFASRRRVGSWIGELP